MRATALAHGARASVRKGVRAEMNAFPRLDQGGCVWLSVKEKDTVRAADFLVNVHVRRQHEELPRMDNLVHFHLRCPDVRSRAVKVVFGIREGWPHIEPCSPKISPSK